MTFMDYHETSSPPHPMIPIASTLLHLVSSITPSSSSCFTPCLPYQPQVILQSFVYTLSAHPSHKQHPCVPCLGYDCLYIIGVGLTHHQTVHRTQVVISLRNVDVFNIVVFSSFFGLDMDCIIGYHQCFPSWFTMPLLIPSYPICIPCQGSM